MSLRDGYAADLDFKVKLKAMPKPKRPLVAALYRVNNVEGVRETLLGHIYGHMYFVYDFYRVVWLSGEVMYAFVSSNGGELSQTWTPERMLAYNREPFTTALRLIAENPI